MSLMHFDPFREFDRIAEQVMGSSGVPRSMPIEAFRRGDQFFVYIDLPGVAEDDIDVTVERHIVNIRAERRSLRQDGDDLLVDERPHGTFSRQLFLGDNLDSTKLTAEYTAGVLVLTVPVAERSKPRRIELSPA